MMKKALSEKPLLEVDYAVKYATISLDMITTDSDLSENAVEKLNQLFLNYISSHKNFRKIRQQYLLASLVFSSITVLKEDVDSMVEKIKKIALDKNNWIPIETLVGGDI